MTSILRNHQNSKRLKVLNGKLKVFTAVHKIMNTKVLTNSQVGCFKMHNSSLKTLDNHIHNYLKPNERKIMGYKTEAALNIILNKG